MRMACDTGGTFTDLVVEDGDRAPRCSRRPTTPDDPVARRARRDGARRRRLGLDRASSCSAAASMFIHGTTRAINAILTGDTARTAFLTTEGHPDILLFREGGRIEPFNFTVPYPEPYVPRALTFEVPERIDADGVRREAARRGARCCAIIAQLRASWRSRRSASACSGRSSTRRTSCASASCSPSTCPGVPFTLSHQLNPILREYRRASSTCIDASLKPLMTRLSARARRAGCATAGFARPRADGDLAGRRHRRRGGRRGADPRASTPGPAMAPVAGRFYAARDARRDTAHRRRHRRHELRREPGAPRPHPVDARDLARASASAAT